MEQTQLELIRAGLEDERDSLRRQLQDHGASVDGDVVEVDVNEGFADSAQATAERSQLLSMVEQLKDHYGEVLAALHRFDAGRYGKCERCGNEIPTERLEAIPAARLCVACKQATGS
jgi:DnaK suppressor protein